MDTGLLVLRTVVGLLNVPVGFQTENLLTARITLPRPNDASRATYLDPVRRVAFYREALSRIESLPGVDRAAMSSQVMLPPWDLHRDQSRPASAKPRWVPSSSQVLKESNVWQSAGWAWVRL